MRNYLLVLPLLILSLACAPKARPDLNNADTNSTQLPAYQNHKGDERIFKDSIRLLPATDSIPNPRESRI